MSPRAQGVVVWLDPRRRARKGRARPRRRLSFGHSEPGRGAPRGPYAALDLGTNNCRLLVARPTADGFRVVDAFSRIVRLGEGLSQTGRLKRSGDRAHPGGAAHLPRQDGGARRRAGAPDRHRGLPRRRKRRRVPRRGARTPGPGARDRRPRNRSAPGRRRLRRTRRSRRRVDRSVRHRRRLLGDHLAGPVSARPFDRGPHRSLGIAAPGRRVARRNLRRRRRHARDFRRHDALRRRSADPLRRSASPAVERCGRFHLLGTSGTVTTIAGVHLDLPRYDRRAVDGLWLTSAEVDAAVARLKGDELRRARRQRLHRRGAGRPRLWRAARFSRRSARIFPPSASASPTGACARAS